MNAEKLDEKSMNILYSDDSFSRLDEGDDVVFYSRDRFVNHLDSVALATLEKLIAELVIEKEPVILDLMAGWDSHISEKLGPRKVVGMGLNRNELSRNRALDDIFIHDLNKDPVLPFPDAFFDVVLNTVSVDYMTKPFEVFEEVERILKPGGLFLVVFSTRMFPQKATRIWRQSSPEERVLIVEDFFRSAGFADSSLFVSEGKARPEDDKYAGVETLSDPVYAVYAEKKGASPGRAQRPSPSVHKLSITSEEVEKRKAQIGTTLCCPHCGERMKKWEVPDSPFVEWDNEYMYICFNDNCPYMVEGWRVMREQGNPGMTYRLMYDPDRNKFRPVPVHSPRALRENIVHPLG